VADLMVSGRRIGSVGAASRAIVGLALVYLAGGAAGLSWSIKWWDPVIGLLILPAIMVGLGLAARHYAQGPVRFTGPLAICITAR
jgi:hypothetical protein